MQSHTPLNGNITKAGNYLWGGALTLAWQQLIHDFIHKPIQIASSNKEALQIVANFNNSPFNKDMLSQQCYYVKSGHGNKTVRIINEQVHKKFHNKSTPKIEENVPEDGIISFAYFFKMMKFKNPFDRKDVLFGLSFIPGFSASKKQHKEQVLVHQYEDDQNFTIELQTTSVNDHIFLIKSERNLKAEDTIQMTQKLHETHDKMNPKDHFEMPKIEISSKREVHELKKVFLKNEKFSSYFFEEIYEIINLDIDESGVKVENQGAIFATRGFTSQSNKPRNFSMNSPFWIVMRQKNHHPYFIAFINKTEDK